MWLILDICIPMPRTLILMFSEHTYNVDGFIVFLMVHVFYDGGMRFT